MKRAEQATDDGALEGALPDASLADEVLLEEGTGEDDGAVGLELDARQATEIRQIFLTTLPDYLEPLRQMVEQLTSGAGDEVRVALTKTLSSMSDAARRVGVADAEQMLEALREDVLLFGDPSESEEAIGGRITSALARLSALTGDRRLDGAETAAESLVVALKGVSDLAPGTLEKLLSAGLVRVDQILSASPDEVAAVSGLDAVAVDHLMLALRDRTRGPDSVRPAELGSPAPAGGRAEPRGPVAGGDTVERTVDAELSLEEARGRTLRLRLRIREQREQLGALELRRTELGDRLSSAKRRIVERLDALARAEESADRLRREESELVAELRRLSARLRWLEDRRLEGAAEDERLARDVDSLARRVDGVLTHLQPSRAERSPPERFASRPEK